MVAVITGGADGIGAACARMLVKKGHRVYDISRRMGQGQGVQHLVADVSDKAALQKALLEVYKREGRVDLLICAAGESLASPGELTRTRDARRIYDVNFWGSVYAANFVLRRMKRQGEGCIVLLSSLTAVLPLPYLGYYTSSKAAVANYAAALAGEARPFGVRVFAALPPGVHTQFSYKRKKYAQYEGDERAPGLARAIKAISTIEQKGQSPERTAASILQTALRKKPPVLKVTGAAYTAAAQLLRAVPTCVTTALTSKIFVE